MCNRGAAGNAIRSAAAAARCTREDSVRGDLQTESEVRSTLFGLNITMASMGWLLAGSVGGWLIAISGFAGLGAFCALFAALGCGLALFSAAKPALR